MTCAGTRRQAAPERRPPTAAPLLGAGGPRALDLDGSRAEREDAGAAAGRVAVEVDQQVDLRVGVVGGAFCVLFIQRGREKPSKGAYLEISSSSKH
jgi:hypothetical protein